MCFYFDGGDWNGDTLEEGKSEIRNPKQTQMTEIRNSKPSRMWMFLPFVLFVFEFVSDFGFRIFRISDLRS